MAIQTWEILANAYQVSGATTGAEYKNKKALVMISPGAAVNALQIPANFLNVGSILRYTASGRIGMAAKGKFTFGLYCSNGEADTGEGEKYKALATTGELENEEALSEVSWRLEGTSRVATNGEAGVILTQGILIGPGGAAKPASAKLSAPVAMLPAKTATGGEVTAVKLNGIQKIALGFTAAAESTEDIVFCYQWLVELLN